MDKIFTWFLLELPRFPYKSLMNHDSSIYIDYCYLHHQREYLHFFRFLHIDHAKSSEIYSLKSPLYTPVIKRRSYTMKKTLVLCILDGYGIYKDYEGNANLIIITIIIILKYLFHPNIVE